MEPEHGNDELKEIETQPCAALECAYVNDLIKSKFTKDLTYNYRVVVISKNI